MAGRFVPLTPRVAARVDTSREEMLDPAFADECMEALECYGVLVFPRIGLSDEEQFTFSSNLGDVVLMGEVRSDGTRDPIYKITLDPRENPSGAEYLKGTTCWHMDGIHDGGAPPKATMLSARRLASTGGQTEFCSTYAAYADLPEEERRACEPLRVVHSLVASRLMQNPNASAEELERVSERRGATEHPLVWQHQSGRKSLILGMSVDHVVDMPQARNDALIERLRAHTTRPENVYQHQWQLGDLVMWDNCGVMHRVTPYASDSGRLMHRTTLHGLERIQGVAAQG